jgi:Uma2 family endonuclease
MSTAETPLMRLRYADAAEAYLRSLPPEHFMEAVPQATQRKITVVSMDLVRVHLPGVQTFSELLIQFPFGRKKVIRQVVPDNFVIDHPEPIRADGSYDLPFQPAHPLLVLEYVSKNSRRKDYEKNHRRYERELKVPYYMVFYPEIQELTFSVSGGGNTAPSSRAAMGGTPFGS